MILRWQHHSLQVILIGNVIHCRCLHRISVGQSLSVLQGVGVQESATRITRTYPPSLAA